MTQQAARRNHGMAAGILMIVALAVSISRGTADDQAPATGAPAKDSVPATPPANQTQTAPADAAAPPDRPEDQGTLKLMLAGNRQFCVAMNELEFAEGSTHKPRQQRNSPLITTMGYKYQISVSRRGTSGVTKLFESPTIRTTYYEKPKPTKETPQPHLPTQKDKKQASAHPFGGATKIPRWIPDSACTTLKPEYSFPLLEGHYDVYLGFDLLTPNGRWVPLQSDFIVDLAVLKGKEARVQGKVDYTAGERVVTLASPTAKKASSGSR